MNLFLLKGESSKPAVPPPRPALIKWASEGWWEPFTQRNHRDKLLDVRLSLHSKKPEVQRRGSRGHSLAGDGSHADAPLGAGVLIVRDELDGAAAPLRDRGVVLQDERPAPITVSTWPHTSGHRACALVLRQLTWRWPQDSWCVLNGPLKFGAFHCLQLLPQKREPYGNKYWTWVDIHVEGFRDERHWWLQFASKCIQTQWIGEWLDV